MSGPCRDRGEEVTDAKKTIGVRDPGGRRAGRAAPIPLSWWLLLAGVGLAFPLGHSASAQSVFLDVIARNRFYVGPESAPELEVRTRQPVRLDVLLYDRDRNLTGFRLGEQALAHHKVQLGALPAAPAGETHFLLVATAPDGRRLGVYPERPGGDETIEVKDVQWDGETGMVTYALPRASYVRIRAGFRNGPYFAPIQNWRAQPAGPYQCAWEGESTEQVFVHLYRHPDALAMVTAVALPVNALVDQSSNVMTSPPALSTGRADLPARLADLASPPWELPGNRNRRAWVVDDYRVRLDVAADEQRKSIEIRVDCDPADRPRLLNTRFELMLFLDHSFIMEDERCMLPFSHEMSVRGIAPGSHVLCVNVVDTQGRAGVASVLFHVGDESRTQDR